MNFIEVIGSAVGIMTGVGVIAAGLGYAYGQFKKGRSQEGSEELQQKADLLTYLKTENEGYKSVIREQNEKIEALGREISALQAAIKEKDNLLDKYMKIIENRNPELMDILKEIKTYMGEMRMFMERVEEHMEQDLTVEAHITKTT